MVIEAVTELSFDYATLDEGHLKFLKTAFKGASAVLVGEDGARTVKVEDLKPLDPIQEITAIPDSLKVAQVVPGLAATLEKRGLLAFKVLETAAAPATHTEAKAEAPPDALAPGTQAAKQRHEAKRVEIKRFLDTIEMANTNREQSSTIIEEMLDAGRAGRFSATPVESVVEDIIRQGSSPAMKAIAGLRGSDQTYAHCTDMAVILQGAYVDILQRSNKEISDANRRFALIAGFMHDIGKSEVPKDILESTQRFAPDSKEMIIMRNHTTYGARILSEMGMPDPTINVAHFHHVKKDDTLLNSYPAVSYGQVLPLTKLASIADVYQALIGRRKYKRNWVPGKAIEYLLSLQGSEFDEKVLGEFIKSMGRYPVGSLLRLSTGDLGFVLELGPDEFPDRPIVAVVENATGEVLGTTVLLDLMMEPDIGVEEVVDHYEHYNESEDQAYQIFQSIRVA